MKRHLTTRISTLALTAVAIFGLTACDDTSGPEGPGSMDVVMHDDTTEASSVSSPNTAPPAQAPGTFSGTFDGDVLLQVSADGETWVDVSSPASVTVDLQSDSETTIATDSTVAAGSYSHVRVVISNATAHIASGAQIGGVTYDAAIDISVGSGSEVTVEKEMFPFSIDGDTELIVSVDLNSDSWVDALSAESKTAAEADIQAGVAVEVRRK